MATDDHWINIQKMTISIFHPQLGQLRMQLSRLEEDRGREVGLHYYCYRHHTHQYHKHNNQKQSRGKDFPTFPTLATTKLSIVHQPTEFNVAFFIIYGLKNIYGQSTNYEYTVLPLDWSTPGKDRTVGPTDDRLLQSQLLLMCNFPFYDAIMNSKLNLKILTDRWEPPTIPIAVLMCSFSFYAVMMYSKLNLKN